MVSEAFTLSKQSQRIIENFAKINEGMVFHKGKTISTITKHKAPDIFAFAKIQETIPTKFGIADVSKFLSLLSLHKEPSLTVNSDVVVIQGDNNRKFSHVVTSDKVIRTITEEDVEGFTPAFEFTMAAADLLSLKKHITVADLPNVVFEGDGKNIVVKGLVESSTNSTADQYVAVLGQTDRKFNIKFEKWKIDHLLDTDYSVGVLEDMVRFRSVCEPFVSYYVAPEIGSVC